MRRFSQTLSSAKRPRPSGTCATPARATASGLLRAICLPSNTISPVWRTVPDTARSVVVLPAPLAPSRATISPSATVSETPCRALIGPYRASTPRSSSSVDTLGPQVGLDHVRICLHLAGRSLRDLAAEVEHVYAVADRHHQLHVVFDEQDRQVEITAKTANHLRKLTDFFVVEPAGGLVEQKQGRLGDECARELDALERPEGEPARKPLAEVAELEVLEHLHSLLPTAPLREGAHL